MAQRSSPEGQNLLIVENSWSHSVGPLWKSGASQKPLPDNTLHSQHTDIHAPGRIRSHTIPARKRPQTWALDRAAIGIGIPAVARVQLKRDGTRWRTGGKVKGNWRLEWVASTLHTTSELGVSSITTADAHNSAASSRLNWRPPDDLNGLVRFAERRNLVSARAPSHFKRSLLNFKELHSRKFSNLQNAKSNRKIPTLITAKQSKRYDPTGGQWNVNLQLAKSSW